MEQLKPKFNFNQTWNIQRSAVFEPVDGGRGEGMGVAGEGDGGADGGGGGVMGVIPVRRKPGLCCVNRFVERFC